MKVLNVKSIYPVSRPSYNEWCKEFNFGARCVNREGINNAQRIMALWDGFFLRNKSKLSYKSMNEQDY